MICTCKIHISLSHTRATIDRTNARETEEEKKEIQTIVRDLIFYIILSFLYLNVQNENVQQQSTNHSWITFMFWVASCVRYGIMYLMVFAHQCLFSTQMCHSILWYVYGMPYDYLACAFARSLTQHSMELKMCCTVCTDVCWKTSTLVRALFSPKANKMWIEKSEYEKKQHGRKKKEKRNWWWCEESCRLHSRALIHPHRTRFIHKLASERFLAGFSEWFCSVYLCVRTRARCARARIVRIVVFTKPFTQRSRLPVDMLVYVWVSNVGVWFFLCVLSVLFVSFVPICLELTLVLVMVRWWGAHVYYCYIWRQTAQMKLLCIFVLPHDARWCACQLMTLLCVCCCCFGTENSAQSFTSRSKTDANTSIHIFIYAYVYIDWLHKSAASIKRAYTFPCVNDFGFVRFNTENSAQQCVRRF